MARKSRKNIEANAVADAPVIMPSYLAGAYVRLSAEDKKQKGDSIEGQQALIRAYIEEHPGIELAETYIDNVSGQSFERPSFTRMVEDMESGRINCCVTKDLSRLGRNAIDTGYYIEKYFPAHGIRYIAINDDYDSADPNSGGIMVNLKNMVNEHYALEIGRKIRQTKQMNIRKGKFVGRLAPYGFLKNDEDNHILVHDPYAAPIVRCMFEMAAEGKGVRAITDWLNDSGILPPKRYAFSIGVASEKDAFGHEHWNKGALYSLLKNRVYCGDMVQGKFKTQSYVQQKLPKSDWIIVEGTHEGIVSRELFDAVQALWAESKPRNHVDLSGNIFLRKVFCGHCGFSLKRRPNKGKGKYSLGCTTRHTYAKGDCVPVSIDETVLKETLLDVLNKKAEVFRLDGTGAAGKRQSEADAADRAELKSIQAEIGKTSRFLQSLYESLTQGDISREEYRDLRAGYEAKIAELSDRERETRSRMVERIANESVKAKAAANLKEVRLLTELTADTLDKLIDRIIVFEDKSIEVHYKFADSMAIGGERVGYERIDTAG